MVGWIVATVDRLKSPEKSAPNQIDVRFQDSASEGSYEYR